MNKKKSTYMNIIFRNITDEKISSIRPDRSVLVLSAVELLAASGDSKF